MLHDLEIADLQLVFKAVLAWKTPFTTNKYN